MAQELVGAFLIRIPVSWLMSRVENPTLFGIGLAAPSSTVIQILLCVLYFLSDTPGYAEVTGLFFV